MKKTGKAKKRVVPDYPGKDIDDLAANLGLIDYDNDPVREAFKVPVPMEQKPSFVNDQEELYGMRNFERDRKTDFNIKKGGRINIPKSKVSTGQKNSKKSSNW
jgi:hypothetical protein